MLDNTEDIATKVHEQEEKERLKFASEPQFMQAGSPGAETPTSEQTLDALSRNQDGDAELFIKVHRRRLVYDHASELWYVFAGNCWREDRIGEALQAVGTVADIYSEEVRRQSWLQLKAAQDSEGKPNPQQAKVIKELLKRVHALQSLKWKNDILVLSRSGQDTLGITGQEWDRDPWLLACLNGVINLKDGTFREGRPEDYIKTAAPTEWQGIDAPCSRWEKFLSEIFDGDESLITFIQRLLGYGITGLTTSHIFIILWGTGRNGKGTLLETMRRVLGDHTMKIEAELLLQQKFARRAGSPNSAVLSLQGRRIVWASEAGDDDSFDVKTVKELVGGDTLNARPIYGKHHVTFEPTHLMLLLTNSMPSVNSKEYAFWKRVVLIPFEKSFVDRPQLPNERKADPDLMEKLKAEAPGILAWLVRGCLAWQKEDLNTPEEVMAAIEKYRINADPFDSFLCQCCTEDTSLSVRAKVFYDSYSDWAVKDGTIPLSLVFFGKEMKKRFGSHQDRKGIVYEGVDVKC
jgi:putative DNA primase/helicase